MMQYLKLRGQQHLGLPPELCNCSPSGLRSFNKVSLLLVNYKEWMLQNKLGQLVRHNIKKANSSAPLFGGVKFKDGKRKMIASGQRGCPGQAVKVGGGGSNVLEREVNCEVEAVSWRERHISASVSIEASEARVWEVLTDYERLAEFIPNLIRSERIPCPHPGRIWLLQEGRQAAMYWHIEARVVLDLLELPDAKDGKELRFSMVDGDFKRYVGQWYLRAGPRPGTTVLHYEVNVTPRLLFPAAFVERIIRADLPKNLKAMVERAEDCRILSRDPSIVESNLPRASFTSPSVSNQAEADSSDIRAMAAPGSTIQALQRPIVDESKASQRLSASVGLQEKTRWGDRDHQWGAFGQSCKLGKPCAVDEVHLRRFDDLLENGGVHRRVVAAITVEAPMHNIWSVLTAYENLPEFIPNLAISEVLSRDKNKVRLLQEGCKCLLYMVLHARVVLDLWEKPQCEIMFQQVEGDFDSFQGKWTLEPLGTQHTLLKYLVDTKMHKDSLLAEAMVEEIIYEDLPANLCAIRDWVELHEPETVQDVGDPTLSAEESETESIDEGATVTSRESSAPVAKPSNDRIAMNNLGVSNVPRGLSRSRKRPVVAGLQRDIKVLERELLRFIAEREMEGVMPMRWELREAGRVDLEKAISRMGGFGPIAARLNLSLAYKERKPRGYWDNLQNVHKEVVLFQKENGKDIAIMPTRRSLEKAGRYDLARSLEKWGGLQEVARVLGLKVRKRQRSQSSKTELQPAQSQKVTEATEEPFVKLPLKTTLPPKSTKWVTMRRGSGSDSLDQC